MKKITLNIEESKYDAFLNFLRTINYVSISEDEFHNIPQWQKEEVQKREQMIEKGEMKTRIWEEAKKYIFSKKS